MKQFLNACLNGSGEFANFAYFFKGDKYTKYNWTNDIIEDGYPMSIEGWNLGSDFNNNIDAAFNGVVLDEPVKVNDHLMDALRYGLYTKSKEAEPGIRVL